MKGCKKMYELIYQKLIDGKTKEETHVFFTLDEAFQFAKKEYDKNRDSFVFNEKYEIYACGNYVGMNCETWIIKAVNGKETEK